MKKKKIKNPLLKRIPREFLGDWKKYAVVAFFLILMIGFVSGMYVANGSMMQAATDGITKYKREDGHFELNKKADKDLLEAIETGKKADVKQYYVDKAEKELEEKLKETFGSDHNEMYDMAYDKAWEEVSDKIDDEYAEAEKNYELNDPDFKAEKVHVYENFFRNESEDHDNDGRSDGTIRVYTKTDDVNLACVLDGALPENENEIAIDRMHADNAGITVGDTITVGGETYKVTGLIAYVNYATLHEKTTDLIFDALKFNVGMVTEEGFDRLHESVHYGYAWRYAEKKASESEEKNASDDFLKALLTQAVVYEKEIEDYVPAYANPAITFATDDMGSDEAMSGVILNILIVIIAFIFAITISNTITKESSAIGTLRALGYTKGELVRHYVATPVIVTLFSAAVGNLLGYTVLKNVVVSIYYDSYSLPVYETIWNAEAFLKTTLIPVCLMVIVNLIVIVRMMQHTPLQFLRHDLKKTKRKKAMRLPKWKFINRFRLRIIFQNLSNYIILLAGIAFIMVMLAMAVGMPSTLDYYQEHVTELMFSKYQYILKSYQDEDKNVIDTKVKDAEKFCMTSLQKKGDSIDEEISVYGVEPDSKYVKIKDIDDLKENTVYISASFAEKYDIAVGDTIDLDEKYENKQYHFKVAGTYDKSQSLAVFMAVDHFKDIFDFGKEEFTGYLCDQEITDISDDDIATVITKRDITKMCDQLDHTMGSVMQYFEILCVLLSTVLIYLLTKIIIEKNENAISMTKILGYDNKEIASLYLMSTTIVVVIEAALGTLIGVSVMKLAWKIIMFSYSGWFAFVMQPVGYLQMFGFVLIGYLIVLFFDFGRIKRIPMDEALKNVE